MALPTVVIVGRPNVGKSSLLNSLARRRISIVDPRAGITRDRVSTFLEIDERYVELVDTGGIGMVDDDQLEDHVAAQIDFAIGRADLILFVVDVQAGRVALDEQIAERLRKLGRPLVLVANKLDSDSHRPLLADFHRLGCGHPLAVSALHGVGRRELEERILDQLGDRAAEGEPGLPIMKLALVGKRNAGKSTFVNQLAGEERVIVSEVPGTTRDAVDVRFQKDGREFVAIDTAGVRKKSSMSDIDFYSYDRALRSIRRCDVALLLIDAATPVSAVDLKLAAAIEESYKPMVFVINKWDLVQGRADGEDFAEYLARMFPHLPYVPIAMTTARDGRNVFRAVDLALGLHRQASERVSTAKLNAAMQDAIAEREPTPKRGVKRVRIYYATQVAVAPPTLVFFCNNPDAVTENYRRFLENRLREILPFAEVPMRLLFRSHREAPPEARSGPDARDSASRRR